MSFSVLGKMFFDSRAEACEFSQKKKLEHRAMEKLKIFDNAWPCSEKAIPAFLESKSKRVAIAESIFNQARSRAT